MTAANRAFGRLLLFVFACLLSVGCHGGGGMMIVPAVSPMPSVSVSGTGKYSVDVSHVPDRIDAGPTVRLTDVQRSVEAGFRNAVGSRFQQDAAGSSRLVFDAFDAQIEESRVLGVMRVRYRARWLDPSGAVFVETSGSAIPRNPIQTGPGHWRDALEVTLEQLVQAYDQEQKRRAGHE